MIVRSLLVTAVALSLLAGCHKATVESYRIPKEKDPEMPVATMTPPATGAAPTNDGNAMANSAVPTADTAGLTWNPPAEWKSKPATAMRKASYLVPGEGGADGDVSITAFPGEVGGELANVNRWRGQVQLPPISEGELSSQVERVEHNGLKFGIVDATGTGANPQRILGAYVPFAGATWFFKLSGPNPVVTKAKPAFLAFLQTIKPVSSTTQ